MIDHLLWALINQGPRNTILSTLALLSGPYSWCRLMGQPMMIFVCAPQMLGPTGLNFSPFKHCLTCSKNIRVQPIQLIRVK